MCNEGGSEGRPGSELRAPQCAPWPGKALAHISTEDRPVAFEGNEKGREKVKGFQRSTGFLAQSLSLEAQVWLFGLDDWLAKKAPAEIALSPEYQTFIKTPICQVLLSWLSPI